MASPQAPDAQSATQTIFRFRREYNAWVADETMEDYALRYTPKSFRRWSEFRVANTAFGSLSFLALEAIGGAIALNAVVGGPAVQAMGYGFVALVLCNALLMLWLNCCQSRCIQFWVFILKARICRLHAEAFILQSKYGLCRIKKCS